MLWPKASRSKRTGRRAPVAVISGRPGSWSGERRRCRGGSGGCTGLLVADDEVGAGVQRRESQGCTGAHTGKCGSPRSCRCGPRAAFSYCRPPPRGPRPRPRLARTGQAPASPGDPPPGGAAPQCRGVRKLLAHAGALLARRVPAHDGHAVRTQDSTRRRRRRWRSHRPA